MIEEVKEVEKAERLRSKCIRPWIAVDLDKTLAIYTDFISPTHIGEPIWPMVERVRKWLDEGKQVKIFTARISDADPKVRLEVLEAINDFTVKLFGEILPVTCIKDYGMVELYDDRAIQVEANTGRLVGEIK